MDRVPLDFSERVSARWRCCNYFAVCNCTTFKASKKWSFSEKIFVNLNLVIVGGKVKYGFTNPDYIRKSKLLPEFKNTLPKSQYMLTIEGLKKRRDFKHIQIGSINLYNKNMSEEFREIALTFLDVELRTLLNFVSYLSNAPILVIRILRDLLHTPERVMIKNWVEESSFTRVQIGFFTSADQRFFEKQFQKANPAYIHVENVSAEEDKHFLEESLESGQLRIFRWDSLVFPFEVLERLIANCQQKPEDHTPGKHHIGVKFDKTTVDEKLAEMAEKGLCEVEGDIYRFHSNTVGNTFCVRYRADRNIYFLWVDNK